MGSERIIEGSAIAGGTLGAVLGASAAVRTRGRGIVGLLGAWTTIGASLGALGGGMEHWAYRLEELGKEAAERRDTMDLIDQSDQKATSDDKKEANK